MGQKLNEHKSARAAAIQAVEDAQAALPPVPAFKQGGLTITVDDDGGVTMKVDRSVRLSEPRAADLYEFLAEWYAPDPA